MCACLEFTSALILFLSSRPLYRRNMPISSWVETERVWLHWDWSTQSFDHTDKEIVCFLNIALYKVNSHHYFVNTRTCIKTQIIIFKCNCFWITFLMFLVRQDLYPQSASTVAILETNRDFWKLETSHYIYRYKIDPLLL